MFMGTKCACYSHSNFDLIKAQKNLKIIQKCAENSSTRKPET